MLAGDLLPHIRRLIALGLEPDYPDAFGLTPVQIAGWEGLPDALAFFLSLGPDLSHVNDYGGDLGDQIRIRLVVQSDGAWSDQDGLWPTTAGAAS